MSSKCTIRSLPYANHIDASICMAVCIESIFSCCYFEDRVTSRIGSPLMRYVNEDRICHWDYFVLLKSDPKELQGRNMKESILGSCFSLNPPSFLPIQLMAWSHGYTCDCYYFFFPRRIWNEPKTTSVTHPIPSGYVLTYHCKLQNDC